MKTLYLSFFLIIVITCSNYRSYSQQANRRSDHPERPILLSPKSHDPNFLKSAKFPDKSFYQRKSEWKHIIDTTWGPGAPLEEKLKIFNTYANAIHDKFDGFKSLKLNWDSLYNHYLSQINDSTSKGAFSSIMSHFAYDLKDLHTKAFDQSVVFSPLNPGVPVLLLSSFIGIEHFGAVTTILPDSTTLVLRVVPQHPLGLEPGDIILGYEGVPWKELVRELFNAGLPMFAMTGGCKSADIYHNLIGAGLNWHLFSSIDILKYSTGDTLHLSVEPMLTLNMPFMANNEQLPVKGIPFPGVLPVRFYPPQDTVVTYGIMENTNIGYIYLSSETPYNYADDQLFKAVDALKNTDALIIDMRINYGGSANFEKAFNVLFNDFHKTIVDAHRCNNTTFELCSESWTEWQINGKDPDYYNRPIAILLGPSCMSFGDLTARQLMYHPMVHFFGASSGSSYGEITFIQPFKDWYISYSDLDVFDYSNPGVYLNRTEFPIDFPVWFNKDDVAKGIDPIVEKAKEWINNLAYGHSIVLNKSFFDIGKDTLVTKATIENPESHELLVKLIIESIDSTRTDSVEMKPVNQAKDWQVAYDVEDLPENFYWLSVKVEDKTNGTFFTNRHMTKFTTVPLIIDSLKIIKNADYNYSIRPTIRNAGDSRTIPQTISVTLTTNSWVKKITPPALFSSSLSPGQVKQLTSFKLYCDTTSFQNHFDLKFTISSQDWPFWAMDTTVAVINTSVENQQQPPLVNLLNQNFPNPFNAETTISWQLAQGNRVTLSVFNILGNKVATLMDQYRPAGKYETKLNAANLPKGIYFYQLKAGKFIQTKKMIVGK